MIVINTEMTGEDIILTPLDDAPVATGYNPNFSLRSQDERREQMAEWANKLMTNADKDGYAVWPVEEVIKGASQFVNYPINWLQDDEWILSNLLHEAGVSSAPHGPLDHFRHRLSDKIVIYSSSDPSPTVRTKMYKRGITFVKFLTLMLSELSDTELDLAGFAIDHWVKNDRYRRHLRGMLRWYNSRRRLLDATTKTVARQAFGTVEAQELIRQLVEMAALRGMNLTPKSIYQLDRVMQLFGNAPGSVHSLLHRAQCGLTAIAEHSANAGNESLIRFDNSNLSEIERQTQEVQRLLADVFQAEEESPQKAEKGNGLPVLLAHFAQKGEWTIDEAEKAAKEHGVALFPALEAINDYAIEKYGDTIADLDDDTLYITLPPDFKL